MEHDRQRSQHFLQILIGHGSHPRTPWEQRRAVLWRERMKREKLLQGLLVRFTVLVQAWQSLYGLLADLEHEMPQVASSIVLVAIAILAQLPTDWQHSDELDRMKCETIRIQHDLLRCFAHIVSLQTQINRLDFELVLLSFFYRSCLS